MISIKEIMRIVELVENFTREFNKVMESMANMTEESLQQMLDTVRSLGEEVGGEFEDAAMSYDSKYGEGDKFDRTSGHDHQQNGEAD